MNIGRRRFSSFLPVNNLVQWLRGSTLLRNNKYYFLDSMGSQSRDVQPGRGYLGNGSSAYVDTNISTNFPSGDFTVYQRVVYDSSSAGYTMSQGASLGPYVTRWGFFVGGYVFWWGLGKSLVSSATLTDGLEYELMMVFDSATSSVECFINGVSQGTISGVGTATVTDVFVGTRGDETTSFFSDVICDTRIYTAKKTPSEITSGSVDDCVLWYGHDEGDGATAINRIGGGVNGTIIGATLSVFHTELFDGNGSDFQNQVGYGWGGYFNGVDNYQEVYTAGLSATKGAFEFKGTYSQMVGSDYFLNHYNSGNRIYLYASASSIGYRLGSSAAVDTAYSLSDGDTIRLEWDDDVATLKVNGVSIRSTAYTGLTSLNSALAVGRIGSSQYYKGVCSRYSFFDSSDDEIIIQDFSSLVTSQILNTGDVTQVFVPRDETDVSQDVLGVPLVYSGRVKYDAPISNVSVGVFDGINDTLNRSNDSSFDLQDFYYELRITKADDSSGVLACLNVNTGTATKSGVRFMHDVNNKFSVSVAHDINTMPAYITTSSLTFDGVFKNIVFSKVGDSLDIFVDGVFFESLSLSSSSINYIHAGTSIYDRATRLFSSYSYNFTSSYSAGSCSYLKIGSDADNIISYVPLSVCDGSDVFDVVSGKKFSLLGVTLASFWGNDSTGTAYPYNLLHGFQYYDDNATHMSIIRVPYRLDGTFISPVISGYSLIQNNPSGDFFNNCEVTFSQENAPELVNADKNLSSDFFFDSGSSYAPLSISYVDLVANVDADNILFNNVYFDPAYKKDLIFYSLALTGSELARAKRYTNQ